MLRTLKRVTDAQENILFVQREEAVERAPYENELSFLSLIRKGDLEGISAFVRRIYTEDVLVGNMSADDLRQMQYLAVALITLATRAAIEEGVAQAEAYSLSDEYILRVDRLNNAYAIAEALEGISLSFAKRISACKKKYSRMTNRCISYISSHLHSPLRLEELAGVCGVSPCYLSRRFHAETGQTLKAYILSEKLEEARQLMDARGMSCPQAANTLGFSSQSHFIACYKRKYGITPGRYFRGGAAPTDGETK